MAATAERAAQALAAVFLDRYPDEFVGTLEEEPAEVLEATVAALPAAAAAYIIERLTTDSAAGVLRRLPAEAAAASLSLVDPGRLAAIVPRLDRADREALLSRLAPADAREIEELMSYPANTAGQLMDVRAPTVRDTTTASQVRDRLRAVRRAGARDLLVVDADGRLAGTVWLSDIALAEPETRLAELVRGASASVLAMATREEVVERLATLKLTSLPVVDAAGRVVGVIAHERLLRAAEQEASADVQTMVGASKDEQALSPILFAVRKRLPWLQINLVTAFLAASVVGVFEETIARYTALAVLLPVVAGQSGNTGAQALAVTMRGLVLREIRVRHWPRVSAKEATVGLINGLGVAATTSLGVWLWSQSAGLAMVIGFSMVISMVAAGLAGAIVPLALAAVDQDPAQSSSIILTTVTDIVGFFSFLGIATMMSGML